MVDEELILKGGITLSPEDTSSLVVDEIIEDVEEGDEEGDGEKGGDEGCGDENGGDEESQGDSQDFLDGIIIDTLDAEQSEDIAALGLEVFVGETLMTSLQIKQDLAQHCLSLIGKINREVLRDV